MSIDVTLQNENDLNNIPDLKDFQTWIDASTKAHHFNMDSTITIRIVDKEESAYLNETFRQKTGPTNVLSFPYDPIPGDQENILGDLAICAPIVAEEANSEGKSVNAHWAHLTIHGMLHLFGYDHIEDEQAKIMEGLEIKILEQLGIANPYDASIQTNGQGIEK